MAEKPGQTAPTEEPPAPMPSWDGSPRLVAPEHWPALHGGLSYREWLAQQQQAYEDREDRRDGYAPYTRLDESDDDEDFTEPDWSY